ncbi:hypothetical protein HW452_05350 [Halomonas aquamarina]|uniref:Uncharacterized protein n=1 Tax=Vreelandella aquamarina TaxID=77097 RepID=A0ACC5VRN6_9GAMM|nr:hypothetical protein [Halomonas aquamarina]MBZ5486948.1 hypothetical protein [Halomonas aquamarina]
MLNNDESATYANEHNRRQYAVFTRQIDLPDGRPGPWLVKFQIELQNGEMSPQREVSDQGAKTRDDAIAIGRKHAEALIDQKS